MLSSSQLVRSNSAALALVVVVASNVRAIPPPEPRPPVGYEEWRSTGRLPKHLFLPSGYEHGHQGVVVSSPELAHIRREPSGGGIAMRPGDLDFPWFNVKINRDVPSRRYLQVGDKNRESQTRSTYLPHGYTFDVRQQDMIPLYDQIYSVTIDAFGVVLSLATDRVPIELRPSLNTRTISVAAVNAELFVQQHSTYENRTDLDKIAVEFEQGAGKAIVTLEPRVSYSGKVPPEGRIPDLPARPPLKIEVAKGEFLTARGRSYKVLNVVPPQDIEGVGRLVGWIELAADPIEVGPIDSTGPKK
jgi:hypothetical protein